jgi:protein phosphatase
VSGSDNISQVTVEIPEPSLILLIGASGSGKSTFAAKHFRATEVVSSDRFRAMLVDDEADQSISKEAFAILHQIARIRLEHQRLTVIDATNLTEAARQPLLEMARQTSTPCVAIVFNFSLATLHANNRARPARAIPDQAVEEQAARLTRTMSRLETEGYIAICHLDETSVSNVVILRNATHARADS